MSDPDMFLNYTPTSAVSDAGKQAGNARHAFPDSVHIPEGVYKAIKQADFEFASLLHMTCLPVPSALASWLTNMTDGYDDHCCLPRHACNASVSSPIHFALLQQTGVNTQYVHQFHGHLTCYLQAAELCPHPIILSPFVAV